MYKVTEIKQENEVIVFGSCPCVLQGKKLIDFGQTTIGGHIVEITQLPNGFYETKIFGKHHDVVVGARLRCVCNDKIWVYSHYFADINDELEIGTRYYLAGTDILIRDSPDTIFNKWNGFIAREIQKRRNAILYMYDNCNLVTFGSSPKL